MFRKKVWGGGGGGTRGPRRKQEKRDDERLEHATGPQHPAAQVEGGEKLKGHRGTEKLCEFKSLEQCIPKTKNEGKNNGGIRRETATKGDPKMKGC